MQPARPLIAMSICLASATAGAQAIYRCGDSYSQQPCEGGRPIAPAAPAPSAADRSQAAAAAARDARLADAMEKDRARREAQAGASATVLPAATPGPLEPHQWPEKAGTRKLDVFTASVPGSRTPKARTPAAKSADKKKDPPSGTAKASGAGKGAAASQSKTVQPVKTAAAGKP